MKVPVFKTEKASGRATCKGPSCLKDPRHITATGKIVKDTLCGIVTVQTSLTQGCLYQYFYCKDCIKWIWQEAQKNFDPDVWDV